MATKTILITSGATTTLPADWSDVNTVICIGPGANGLASTGSGTDFSGGGGSGAG